MTNTRHRVRWSKLESLAITRHLLQATYMLLAVVGASVIISAPFHLNAFWALFSGAVSVLLLSWWLFTINDMLPEDVDVDRRVVTRLRKSYSSTAQFIDEYGTRIFIRSVLLLFIVVIIYSTAVLTLALGRLL